MNKQNINVVSIKVVKTVKTPVKDFTYGSERAGLACYVISSTIFNIINLTKLIHWIDSPTLSANFCRHNQPSFLKPSHKMSALLVLSH